MSHHKRSTLARIGALAALGISVALVLAVRLGVGGPAPVGAATKVTVNVGGASSGTFYFCQPSAHNNINDCITTIDVGDTVSWSFLGGIDHTSTECTGVCGSAIPGGQLSSRVWHSGNRDNNSSPFEFTFITSGTFDYQCNIHPGTMKGRIIVQGGATPAPTSTSPAPSATPTAPQPSPTATSTPPGAATATPTSPAAATATPTSSPLPAATATRTATPSGLLVGDVNGDGRVDAIDAALVLQFNAGILGALPNPQAADTNLDGSVNAIDAALILQFGAGLLDQLPP